MFCSFNSGLALTKLLKAQVAASSRSLLLFQSHCSRLDPTHLARGVWPKVAATRIYLASEAWQVASVAWNWHGQLFKRAACFRWKKISLSQNLRHQRPVNARSVTMFRTLGQQYSQCSCSSTRWARFKVMMGHSGSMCHTEPSNVGCTNTVSPSGHGAWWLAIRLFSANPLAPARLGSQLSAKPAWSPSHWHCAAILPAGSPLHCGGQPYRSFGTEDVWPAPHAQLRLFGDDLSGHRLHRSPVEGEVARIEHQAKVQGGGKGASPPKWRKSKFRSVHVHGPELQALLRS